MAATRPRPAFSFGGAVELVVRDYRRALLSLPALGSGMALAAKDLLSPGPASSADKYSLEEHLQYLTDSGQLADDRPLLALGMRNSLVNLRCPVIAEGRIHAVTGEAPLASRRPYFGMGARAGRLSMGEALGTSPEDWTDADFFCAGIPVFDERFDDAALFDLMLTETADHSHLFDLPRGNHPRATEVTRDAWSGLHGAFTASLESDRSEAVTAMRRALYKLQPQPPRCANYLHAVLGIGGAGELCCVFANGLLEAVGRRAAALGAQRALCVENSGSVMPTFFPEGAAGPAIPLLRAPNFRPKGRALLVIELETSGFDSLEAMV